MVSAASGLVICASCVFGQPSSQLSTAEVIRCVVTAVDTVDITIEEQSIEEVVKRIYTGEVRLETPTE